MNNSDNISNIITNGSYENEVFILDIVNFYVNDLLGSIVFILGIIFNVLSFTYFQLSRSFHDTSMRHYFSVLSITDSLRLSEWFFLFLLNKKVIFLSRQFCSVFLYVTITSGHISVWLLVFLSIERYVILQFPFRGKRFYTTRNSLRTLCLVILILIIADIPYLLPSFVKGSYINYKFNLHMCITNPQYRTYIYVNNILFYSLIPFFILLVSNCLLISSLSRQNNRLFNLLQQNDEAIILNQKRERQFKERTVLLISVTFFLVLTVSPRYIAQFIFLLSKHRDDLFRLVVAKCFFILEMLNFGSNFVFYIICSKTSRKELYLIIYYFFCWKWSAKSKKYTICNHPNHNSSRRPILTNQNSISYKNSSYTNERDTNLYNMSKKNSKSRINCFLINASRLKTLESNYNRGSKRSSAESNLKEDSIEKTLSFAESSLRFSRDRNSLVISSYVMRPVRCSLTAKFIEKKNQLDSDEGIHGVRL